MPSVPELEGWALACAAAERLGWQAIHSQTHTGGVDHLGRKPGSVFTDRVPAYHASFDACERDLLPVLREAGWEKWSIEPDGAPGVIEAMLWGHGTRPPVIAWGACAAEALSRAFLQAVTSEDAAP